MNSRIKTTGIVLTGGVILGWGSSAALALNVVGTGMYGNEGDASMANDIASDVVSWDPATGLVTLTYGNNNGISLDPGTPGQMVAVLVDTPGENYLPAEEVTQDADNTGTTGLGFRWDYEVDGTPGAWDDTNLNVVNGTGTGYISVGTNTNQTNTYSAGIQFDVTCAGGNDPELGFYDTWAGGAGVAPVPGLVVYGDAGNPCFAFTAPANGSGTVCGIDISRAGVGYDDGVRTFEIFVNGVLNPAYGGTYTCDASGGITNVDFTSQPPGLAPDYPTDGSQVTMVPSGPGAGVEYKFILDGALDDINIPVLLTGTDCQSVALPAVWPTNICIDCGGGALIIGGEGGQVSVDQPYTGSVENAFIFSSGDNYDMAPAISIDQLNITQGTGATFTAIMGAANHVARFKDGTPGVLPGGDDWGLYCGADYNADGQADIVAHNASTGAVALWCMGLDGTILEELIVSVAGIEWHIVGQLNRTGGAGHCLLWRNNTTGANCVWIVDGNSATNGGQAFQPESGYIDGAATDWYSYATNDSAGGGTRNYWYNDMVGDNAVWSYDIDTTKPRADWVTSREYCFTQQGGLLEQVNTGPYSGWEMQAVGCLSGDPMTQADRDRDICWGNANTGGVCLWMMDDNDANLIASRGYCTINGAIYDGSNAGTATGYMCVGVGQYEANVRYIDNTPPFVTPVTGTNRNQNFGSLWWNYDGNTYVWRMDRRIELQQWTIDGGTGSGVCADPENVTAFTRY